MFSQEIQVQEMWVPHTLAGCADEVKTCRRYTGSHDGEKGERGIGKKKKCMPTEGGEMRKGRKKENKSKKEQLLKMLS